MRYRLQGIIVAAAISFFGIPPYCFGQSSFSTGEGLGSRPLAGQSVLGTRSARDIGDCLKPGLDRPIHCFAIPFDTQPIVIENSKPSTPKNGDDIAVRARPPSVSTNDFLHWKRQNQIGSDLATSTLERNCIRSAFNTGSSFAGPLPGCVSVPITSWSSKLGRPSADDKPESISDLHSSLRAALHEANPAISLDPPSIPVLPEIVLERKALINRTHPTTSGWMDSLSSYVGCKQKDRYKTVAGLSGGTYVGSNLLDEEKAKLLTRGLTGNAVLADETAPVVLRVGRSAPWRIGWAVVAAGAGVATVYHFFACD